MVETKGSMNPLLRSPYMSNPETEQKMDVDWFSMPTNQNEFSRMLGGDFLMVIFSILFVGVWIMMHTWSPLIGGMGMLQILLSLPVTYTIYSLFAHRPTNGIDAD